MTTTSGVDNEAIRRTSVEVMRLTEADEHVIRRAYEHLEHPSLAIRLTSVVGTPVETGLKLLPKPWKSQLDAVAETAIHRALEVALSSLRRKTGTAANERHDKLLGICSGGLSGLFGLPALFIELPITTTIMLRAIADIARSEGQELDSPEGRLRCLEVFALGGRSEEDDAAETGYYGIRLALSMYVSNVSRHVVEHGLAGRGGPAVLRLVSIIASRFGVVVTEKAAAQAAPWVGAAGGALLNAVFMQHFQDMARSHFALLRLERQYGREVVQAEYERLSAS